MNFVNELLKRHCSDRFVPKFAWILGALLLLSSTVLAATPRSAPLPVAVALGIRSLSPFSLPVFSNDGELLAYEVQDPLRAHKATDNLHTVISASGVRTDFLGCDIWITNVRGGEAHNVTGGVGTNVFPFWSPDGRYLAFLSDRSGETKVWLWERSSGSLHPVSDTPVIVMGYPMVWAWTSDSKKILVAAISEGMSIEDEIDFMDESAARRAKSNKDSLNPLVYKNSAAGSKEPQTSSHDGAGQVVDPHTAGVYDLVLMELATGKVERLVRRIAPLSLNLSPDGQSAAFMDYQGSTAETLDSIYNLTVVDLHSGRTHVTAHGINAGMSWSWSPDSRSLVYSTHNHGEYFLVAAVGGPTRQLASSAQVKFDSDQAPFWDQAGATLYVKAADGASLWSIRVADGTAQPALELTGYGLDEPLHQMRSADIVRTDAQWIRTLATDKSTRQTGIYRIDLKTHRFTRVSRAGMQSISDAVFSPDGKRVIWKQQDGVHSPDLWISDEEFKDPRRLTHVNPELDEYVLGETRVIEWHTVDGKELHGRLTLPTDYREGRKYGLVVCFYGCGFNLQLLATRGYAVLFADYFAGRRTAVADLAKSVLPGIDRAIELGIADPERIGLIGVSYAGYGTLALITESPRFKAAVSVAGFSDLFTAYGEFEDGVSKGVAWSETDQGNMGGSPWQYQKEYLENSPFFYLDRVQTPVLLIHGTDDEIVPPWLGDQTFVALRRLGKDVTYVKYRNGGHGYETFSHADQIDYCNRVIEWFDKYLNSSVPAETAAQ